MQVTGPEYDTHFILLLQLHEKLTHYVFSEDISEIELLVSMVQFLERGACCGCEGC